MRPASSFLFIQLSNARVPVSGEACRRICEGLRLSGEAYDAGAVPAFICVFDYRDDFKYFIRSSVCTIWKNEL